MSSAEPESYPVRSDDDVVRARRAVRAAAEKLAFSLVDQTKLVTAASELARNAVVHGGGGDMRIQAVCRGAARGLQLTFEDQGPGIPDISLALEDGYTTENGLGLGLGGARRLVNEFHIESRVGAGTRVSITRWKR